MLLSDLCVSFKASHPDTTKTRGCSQWSNGAFSTWPSS